MNEQSNFGVYQDGVPAAAPPPRPPNMGSYQFSPDELRVLKQCNEESFYQRSLPIGTTLGLGAFFAVQSGYLRSSPRFGPVPKVTLAVIAGYMIGKLSYQQACAEKLMALPGSYLGQMLRERRDGRMRIGSEAGAGGGAAAGMLGARAGDVYSDAGPGSALDLDSHRPVFSDDSYRPPQSDVGAAPGESPASGPERAPPAPALSYDELRLRNRGDHTAARHDPYRVDPALPATPRAPPPPPAHAPRRPVNKYGDEME